ncbi:MAG: pectinesterase family protein [Bacteroidota bacterium]
MKTLIISILALVLGFSLLSAQTSAPKTHDPGSNTSKSAALIDVWDFGAVQLDNAIYNNHLDSAAINSWYTYDYTTTFPGGTGRTLPATFTSGVLTWTTNGTNDRLRTTDTRLTRYDANIASVLDYTGRIYVNSGANVGRYLSLTLNEDDEVTVVEKTDAGGKINFYYVENPAAQTDVIEVTSNLDTLHFVAKAAGTYRLFDTQGKPSYFRIYRKDATYVNVTGNIDLTNAAGLADGYGISFTNEAGKVWNAVISSGSYSVTVPAGYKYNLALTDASGYIISSGKVAEITESTTTHDIALLKVDLYTVSGKIIGLSAAQISGITLVYTPDPAAGKIYVPEPVAYPADSTYTVMLEPSCQYTVSASGINDYYITDNTLTITGNETHDLTFATKPLYNVNISTTGLTVEMEGKLSLTFTNLNEEGYSYSFPTTSGIMLRDGVYAVTYSGLDDYPVRMALTSNLAVNGGDVSKALSFVPVTVWSFEDKVITNATPSYKGLLFTGNIANEIAKGHLVAKPAATVQVPMNPGEKMKVSYYYSAAFTIEGGSLISTSSGSTNVVESVEYVYTGADAGYVTITFSAEASTSYITEIEVLKIVSYAADIHVGPDKEYKTVNEALDAISRMDRTADQRVTVWIDPGNYEEMLVISQPSVTLKNAAAEPSIELLNKGADIASGAVRITGYYGHGYTYYSMGSNQKWNPEILAVNIENGYPSYINAGAGTTNGSYWNATVVVSGSGFEAENIIFENSFNQYISRKESEDVVVEWEVGGKGTRPTDEGNTAVQTRSFVERAAALAIANNTDKVILNNCRIVGRQDAFYGGSGSRVAVIGGAVMGAVDYIFGGMTVVFYKTDLVMNTSDESVDAAYLTAAQQTSGRGYLMYKCVVKSTVPGVETASTMLAKPGYFGRPWQANTSEVVFFRTVVETSGYTGFEGNSLIMPAGWTNSLGGESPFMYEYATFELSGEDNHASRAAWATYLTSPNLNDGTEITPFAFTKGSDDWDPIVLDADDLSVSASSLQLAAGAGSTASFDISSNVKWFAASDAEWLSLSETSGEGDQSITVTATENTAYEPRTATLTVSGYWVDQQTITVSQDASTIGIERLEDRQVKLYPNPAAEALTVSELPEGSVLSVYNGRGELMLTRTACSNSETIDLSTFSNGVYLLKITGKQTVLSTKFVKR